MSSILIFDFGALKAILEFLNRLFENLAQYFSVRTIVSVAFLLEQSESSESDHCKSDHRTVREFKSSLFFLSKRKLTFGMLGMSEKIMNCGLGGGLEV